MDASKHPYDAQDFKVSKGYANYVFLLLFLLYLFNYVDRMVVAAIFPYLKATGD